MAQAHSLHSPMAVQIGNLPKCLASFWLPMTNKSWQLIMCRLFFFSLSLPPSSCFLIHVYIYIPICIYKHQQNPTPLQAFPLPSPWTAKRPAVRGGSGHGTAGRIPWKALSGHIGPIGLRGLVLRCCGVSVYRCVADVLPMSCSRSLFC